MKTLIIILAFIVLQMLCIQQNTFGQDSIPAFNPVKQKFKAEPLKATMMAVVFPGLGQIYNRKYWKIPLVYGGFGAAVYFINFTSSNYITFLEAYQDFTDNVTETNSFMEIPGLKGLDPQIYDRELNPQTFSHFQDQLLRKVDYYKRYRDLSYIAIAAWYLVSILDANVDASLYNYDISDNLDIVVLPVQMPIQGGTLGAGINVSFKVTF